jgi:DHA1 family multidrug resistance protein-like MFS transporter
LASNRLREFIRRRELVLLFLINAVMSLGMNLTNALWPLYVQSLGATVLQVSFLISITGLAGTLLRIPSGVISDTYGRRNIIIASIALAISPPLLYTFTSHWEQLIPWGIVYAIAFALYMPSRMAIVADYTSVETRMRVYSIMNLAFPLGSLISPTLSGILENAYGWNAVFYMATALYVVCLLPSLLLPKPPRQGTNERVEPPSARVRLDFAFFRSLSTFFLLNFFTGLGMGTVSAVTPIYLTERFHVSTAEVGLFISVGFGLTTILTQLPAGVLAEKVGRKRFITACLALIPVLFVLWTSVQNFLLLLPVQMAINGLWSMTWPSFLSLLMEHVPISRRGVSSGITQAGIMLGFTVGPTIGGYLWESLGTLFLYYASAIFFALCLPIVPYIKEAPKTM